MQVLLASTSFAPAVAVYPGRHHIRERAWRRTRCLDLERDLCMSRKQWRVRKDTESKNESLCAHFCVRYGKASDRLIKLEREKAQVAERAGSEKLARTCGQHMARSVHGPNKQILS